MRNCIFVFCLLLIFSCKDSASSGIINKEKMQAILWDVFKADALAEQIALKDSGKSRAVESAILTKKIFLIHHITEEEFKKSYSYYTDHPDIMRTMLDSINIQQTRIPTFVDSVQIRKRKFQE